MGSIGDPYGIAEGQVWRRKRDGRRVRVIDWQVARGVVGLWWPGLPHGCIPATGRETWKLPQHLARDFELVEEGGKR